MTARFRSSPAHTTSQFARSLQNQYSQPAACGRGARCGISERLFSRAVYTLPSVLASSIVEESDGQTPIPSELLVPDGNAQRIAAVEDANS